MTATDREIMVDLLGTEVHSVSIFGDVRLKDSVVCVKGKHYTYRKNLASIVEDLLLGDIDSAGGISKNDLLTALNN